MLLNESQMKVFKSLVYLKKSTIGKIAQETGMHRQSVKIILKLLIKKGFVKESRVANRIYYKTLSLGGIKSTYINNLNELKHMVPSLKMIYTDTKDTQIINSLTGAFGLRSLLLDEIFKGDNIRSFRLSEESSEFELEFRQNDERRKRLGIPLKVLTAFSSSEIPLAEQKNIMMKSKVNLYIYANKMTIFYNDTHPKIFSTKIPEITRFFRDIFDNHWRKN